MAYQIRDVDMRFQGINLNCGRYCLESLMRWKHGTPYGAEVVGGPTKAADGKMYATYGDKRTGHAGGLQYHIDKKMAIGFQPESVMETYGLIKIVRPSVRGQWERRLAEYGPMIVSGHVGAVRISPLMRHGHYILVAGVTDKDQVEYYDSLRPMNCVSIGLCLASMSIKKFTALTEGFCLAAAAKSSGSTSGGTPSSQVDLP